MLKIQIDSKVVDTLCSDLGKKMPKVMADTVNVLGGMIKDATIQEMRTKFKPSTSNWVLNSFSFKKATASRPVGEVFYNRGRNFMQIQVDGGVRKSKGAETLLRNRKVLPSGMAYLPVADKDNYGNLSAGTRSRVLSYFQTYTGTNARNNRQGQTLRNGMTFFAMKSKRGKLSPGVFQRIDDPQTSALRAQRAMIAKKLIQLRTSGFGFAKNSQAAKDLRKRLTAELTAVNRALRPRGIKMVMAFDKIKAYQPLIKFYEIGQKIINENMVSTFQKVASIELNQRLSR